MLLVLFFLYFISPTLVTSTSFLLLGSKKYQGSCLWSLNTGDLLRTAVKFCCVQERYISSKGHARLEHILSQHTGHKLVIMSLGLPSCDFFVFLIYFYNQLSLTQVLFAMEVQQRWDLQIQCLECVSMYPYGYRWKAQEEALFCHFWKRREKRW